MNVDMILYNINPERMIYVSHGLDKALSGPRNWLEPGVLSVLLFRTFRTHLQGTLYVM